MRFSELPEVSPVGPPPKLCPGPNGKGEFKATPSPDPQLKWAFLYLRSLAIVRNSINA